MDGAMGQEEDVVEAVLTCEGDFHDPELNNRIERFRHRLKDLLLTEKQRLQVKKVEPWNSVKVTFTIPREAALRLRQLAQTGNDALRQMGVLSVQIQGDTQISLTIAGRNNESTQLLLCTPPTSQAANSSLPLSTESGISNSEELDSSQACSNDELTRKNIVHYLRQGSVLRQNQAFFDTILGTGTSSVPVLGFGLDISQPMDSISGPSGSNTLIIPNNIATSALQSQTVGGSHLSSSFPFTTTGAFHPPVPRVPFSAGQRSATNSTHHIQPGNISSGRLMGSLGHDPLLNTQPSLSDIGLDGHVFQHNMNSFSPVGAIRHSSSTMSTTMSSISLHAPLPSSPTSSFMIDLPPPPPYPSGSNISRQGKPVTSSSPLLVNLLQTDPLTAAVGLASGNPNKPMTTGELSSNSPLKKKQQSKKAKDGLMKPYLFSDNPASNRTGSHIRLFSSDMDLDGSNPRIPEDTITSMDLIQSRLGLHSASHILDSFITSLPDSRSLFSSDHPVSESPPLEEFHTDLNRRSAVGAGCSSSKISDSNGQEQFSSDLDPFSMEIAAGKIINPYTGQLEPRDSFVDSVQVRPSEQTSHSQGDHFATQMLARKAKELKKVLHNRVPDLPSQMLDAHVWKTAAPIHINVSTSAAAFVHSGGPLQASSDKLTSVSSHRRNVIGDGSPRETKESSFSSSVYAVTGKPWQEVDSSADVTVKLSSNTLTNSSPRKMSSALSTSLHKNFTPTPVPLNGPTTGGQAVRHNVNPSQHHHAAASSSSSGLRLSPQGSVIYSSVTKSSSLPLLPVSHNSYITQTQSQQLVASTATNHLTAPLNMQNSVSNTAVVSSSISHPSRLGSTSFSSLQPPLVTERLKPDPSHVVNQHTKAASSDIAEGSTARQNNPPNLLKSLPNKHVDPQNNTCSPPDNKASSEGDENSNHSGLITDTLPEHSGTAALLEHSGVKAENHDSGVGSSSERSDDTPSEPGDSEFRSGHVGSEIEDAHKSSLQKTVNCKLNSKMNSSANTITVGYMVSPSDGSAQSKSVHLKESVKTSVGSAQSKSVHLKDSGKTSVGTAASPATAADISQFFQAHIMSMDKQTGLLTGGPHASVSMSAEGGKAPSHPSFAGKIRENGQGFDDMQDNSASVKLNGPSSQSSIEKLIKTMSDLQHKKSRSSPKQNNMKALMDMPSEHLKLQTEVLEKMSKLHQFAESTKDASDVLTKPNSSDKCESPDALSQRLIVSEDRPDQLIFDLEELVNGKTVGHGGGGAEVKGGSNITSIYSKRSSPVNVNMLNHIYAPGLPLPRRLTESVQRLVKPLPASETSVSYPQVRPCKSPGSGGSPRAGSGISIQSSPRMSGVRSPGASTPKLLPSDKHSLLSGGLDLAGFPNLKHTPSVSPDQPDLATALANCKRRSPALTADVLVQDPHCFPISQNSPPNLLLDSKSYSGKMLSQSFPPHKSREFKPNITHMNHGLILSLQSNSSVFEKGLSSSVHTTHHCQLPRSKGESLQSTSQDSRFYPSNRSHQDIWLSNHVSSVADTGQARQAPQQSASADNTHSTNNSHAVETSSAYTSHSNASSPVMPVLQRGLEPPGTPTVASSMPNISSQPSCSISSLKEISVFSIGSSLSLTDASVSSQNKHVPYSNNMVGTSGTAVNATAKSPPVSTSSPLLTSVSTAPPAGLTEDLSSYPAPPRLSLSAMDVSSSTKMKKTTLNNPSPSSRNGSNTPQFSRNLFESVSGTLTHDSISISKMEPASNNSGDSFSHGSSRLTAYGSDSKSDSFSSALVSPESKGDLMVKNMRNKSNDGVEKRAATVVSHCSSKTDLNKISPASKSKQTSRDLSLSTFLSTEVVNLDFSLPLQACNAISLNIGANKGTSRVGSTVKTSYSAPGDVQDNTSLHSIQSYTSSISSVSNNSSGMSWTLDVSEVTSSVGPVKEEAASKMPPSLSISNPPSVKEPILEVLASALESSMTKASVAASGKSFVKKQAPSCSMSLEFQQVNEDTTTEGKMITIQSGPNKPTVIRHHQLSLELSHPEHAADQRSDPFSRRLGKKRKSANSDDETDASSVEFTPINQPHISHSHGSPIRSTSKSPVADSVPPQIDSPSKPDGADSTQVEDEKSHTQTKSPTAVTREPLEQDTEKSVMAALGTKQEDKYTPRNTYKSRRISGSDNKEQVSNTEGRPHRSLISSTDSSDEAPSNRSSSNESRDSTYRESRFHRNAVASTADSKERRAHRAGTASAATDDKDLPKDGHSSKLSVDHLENSHRDIRSHRSTSDTTDEKDDNKESRTQRSSSADDKDKTKSGKDIAASNWDKANADSKLDDAHKKSHRIRRQFYAYVPEKSIDQTYFDTPILSSRTRSRNKPSDKPGSDTASGQDEAVPAASAGESQAHHSIGGGLQAATAKADGSAESTGGKRPMRSVRARDNSQDQNASKRRRVQQQR